MEASKVDPKIEEGWKRALSLAFQSPHMVQLKEFLLEEKKQGHIIYPPAPLIFNAFNITPFDRVKVVILGQDPYHGPGQAHGLCFSVPKEIPIPPSLMNIFKELADDLHLSAPEHGDLTFWASQGVLLLNAVLTVRAHSPASHANRGWEWFTDAAIQALSIHREGLVFLLWGAYAQKKEALIDLKKHLILKSTHPSPLSAHKGFLGCRHFSTANEWLESRGEIPIRWA